MSLYNKPLRREFLWQGAPEAWRDRFLLLFPAAGRIDRSRILVRGQEYPMPMHGFAKDMDFSVEKQDNETLVLALRDNNLTRAMFPYMFTLQVTFSLRGVRLYEHFTVYNHGKDEMFFNLGAHPGFFCPIVAGESAEDYVLVFDSPQTVQKIVLEPNTRLCTQQRETLLDGQAELPLCENFFAQGPILSEGYQARWIKLLSKRSGIYMRMGIEKFPYMTFWGVAHRMSLICLEPWCGISDFVNTDHIWEKKPGGNRLETGARFDRELWFEMGVEMR